MRNWKADSMEPDYLYDHMYSIMISDCRGNGCTLWSTTPDKAKALAEKILDAINNYEYEFENNETVKENQTP